MKESKFKGRIERCEIESLVNPLKDREPTDKWRQELKALFKHLHFGLDQLQSLASASNKTNRLNNKYTSTTLQNIFQRYRRDKVYTETSRQAVNDHLDLLINYFVKPEAEMPKVEAELASTVEAPAKEESWADLANKLRDELVKQEEITKSIQKPSHKVKLRKVHIYRVVAAR